MSDAARAIPAVGRRPVHTRRVVCEGFARDDGLFDIEGTLTDTKPFVLALPERVVDVGRPIHQMKVRLAIDRDFVIHEAEARTLHAPYAVCGDITDSYRQLVGLRIQPGFTQAVKRRFRGVLGCSHMTELLPPMATTAFQILWSKPAVQAILALLTHGKSGDWRIHTTTDTDYRRQVTAWTQRPKTNPRTNALTWEWWKPERRPDHFASCEHEQIVCASIVSDGSAAPILGDRRDNPLFTN